MTFLKRWAFTLATGYIFVVFSEHVFWSRSRPGEDSLGNYLAVWVAYSLVAFIFLTLVEYFRVKTFHPLFLVGAVVGWLAEGVIVQTMYESLPLSISFTGLAWHAILTVWLGWYVLRRALLKSFAATLKLAALIGVGWGLWAMSWWYEEPTMITSPLAFARYAFIVTVLLTLIHVWYDRLNVRAFKPTRAEVIVVTLLFALYFAFLAVPAVPIAPVILLPLLLLVFWSLRTNRKRETEGSVLEQLTGHVPFDRYALLFLIPFLAVGIYTVAHTFLLASRPPTHWLLYLVTTPLGFILFGMSVWKIWRRNLTKRTLKRILDNS